VICRKIFLRFVLNSGRAFLVEIDALQDADGNGFTNLEEFKARSDPPDPNLVPSLVTTMPWLAPLLLSN